MWSRVPDLTVTTKMLLAAHAATSYPSYLQWNDDGTTDAGSGRVARLARNIIQDSEGQALMDTVATMHANMDGLDSTDGLPAYETYVRDDGVDKHPIASELAPLMARMTKFAREAYSDTCSECHLCSVLLRRYMSHERMRVPSHFDRNSIVTAVASLNGGLHPAAFDGGFFLQRTVDSSSRQFLTSNRTDAIFHSYDLNHGVDVLSGTRYSAIFWFSDSEESCRQGTSPWYQEAAAAGSMDAQEALAELHQIGSGGYPRDAVRAAALFTLAAEQGSAASQSKLGRMLLAGEGVPRDASLGIEWVRRAADQGYGPAEHTMGVACQYGDVPGGLEAAVKWFTKGAEAGIAASQYELGAAYINGDGVEEGQVVRGAIWLHRAAAQGNKDALADLKVLSQDEAWSQVEVEMRRHAEGHGGGAQGLTGGGRDVKGEL